jgi:rubredoxin
MPRNPVQFQKRMSEADFDRLYGTETQCREALFAWHRAKGFTCPVCGGGKYSFIETRARYQCSACRFNRRFNLASLSARLAYVALRTPPMHLTESPLKATHSYHNTRP